MTGILIHKHTLGCGGIGDFIRASISFYSICKRYGHQYFISFEGNNLLYNCFETIPIPQHINNLSKREIDLINGTCKFEFIQPVLDVLNQGLVCELKSNLVGFESNDNINKVRQEYLNVVLKPTNHIKEAIKNIYNEYNLSDNNYISIHVRCGDRTMGSKISKDIRVNIDSEETYKKYNGMIKYFEKIYSENLPIVLHSDSTVFKNKMKELNPKLIILDIDIKHIAEDIGNNTPNSYISTIAEFYIISKARKIYMPDVYSGFSHIASILEGKQFFTHISEERLDMLKIGFNLNIINKPFDIVVPVGPNDYDIILINIQNNMKNIVGYRNFYAVCYDTSIELPSGVIKIDEKIFPFSMKDVQFFHGKIKRNGWYLQQLIKLYASFVIPDILDTYLVIDADTIFTKPTTFIKNRKCLYAVGIEYHLPYFNNMKNLHKDLVKIYPEHSGICHHMIFEKNKIQSLFKMVEDHHKNISDDLKSKFSCVDNNINIFWKLFLIYSLKERNVSGMSEYEIYFNYIFKFFPSDVEIRKLNWSNVKSLDSIDKFDYVSCHWFMREKTFNPMELVKEIKMFYSKPVNIDVFHSYFSLNGEPLFRRIYNKESDTKIILRNGNTFMGEDPRPFKLNGKEFVVTQRFYGNFETVENYIVDINTGESTLYKVNRPNFFYGKNWTPFVYLNQLYILHRFDPFTLILNGEIIVEVKTNLPVDGTNFCQYRGGSNGLQISQYIVVGIGHRTFTSYDHVPFIWKIDFEKKTLEIMNLVNFQKKERINDPTSLFEDNCQLYLSIFESSKRWHDPDLNCRSLIYKIDINKCVENSKSSDYYKFNF